MTDYTLYGNKKRLGDSMDIEKLGITPIKRYYGEQARPYCDSKEVRELEQQNKVLLEALNKITGRLQAGSIDEWTVKVLAGIGQRSIEKATGKTWEEIKQITLEKDEQA